MADTMAAAEPKKKKRRYLTRRGRPSMKPEFYVMLAGEINAFGTGMRGVVVLKEARKWVTLYYPAGNCKARVGTDVWKELTGRRSRWWPAEYRTERGRKAMSHG